MAVEFNQNLSSCQQPFLLLYFISLRETRKIKFASQSKRFILGLDSTETNSSSYFVIGKICQHFFFCLRLFLLLSCSPSLVVYLYLQSLLRGSGFYLFLVVHLSLITLHQLAAT